MKWVIGLCRCLPATLLDAALGGLRHGLGIGGRAHIAGTRIESGRPHFFVRHAMRAHDGRPGEFAMQRFHVLKTRSFDVHYSHIGAIARNLNSQFLQRIGNVDGMIVKAES